MAGLPKKTVTQFAQQFVTAPPVVGCVVWSPFHHIYRDSVKFLQFHKNIVQLLLPCLVPLLNLSHDENSISGSLARHDAKLHVINCGWSSNLIALYEPHTSGSPSPLYTCTRILFLQSSGIQPSLKMLLIRSFIHLVPKPPDAFIISLTTTVGPTAFPIFNHLIAAATSSSEMRQQGPITSGQLTSPFHSFSTFRSCSICPSYRLHYKTEGSSIYWSNWLNVIFKYGVLLHICLVFLFASSFICIASLSTVSVLFIIFDET